MLGSNQLNFAHARPQIFIGPSPVAPEGTAIVISDETGILDLTVSEETLKALFLLLAEYEPIQDALDQAILNTGRRLGYELKVKPGAGKEKGRA